MSPLKILACLPALAVGSFFAAAQSPSFTLIGSSPLADTLTDCYGAAWGDYNNDGFEDVFLSNGSNANKLFKNDGAGGFIEISFPELTTTGAKTYAATWGDYDNDGYLDLFIPTSAKNILLKNNGDGSFTSISNPLTDRISFAYSQSQSGAWVDINSDGWLDALEVNNIKKSNYYINSPEQVFTRYAIDATGSLNNGVWSDADSDGYPELLMTNEGSNNLFYDNDAGALSPLPSGDVISDLADFYGGAWGDYDNDGDMDLFVTTGGVAPNLLFRNDNGVLTKITDSQLVSDAADSRGAAWGDFDNDGWLDLYVAVSGDNNLLYRNNGDGTFTKETGSPVTAVPGYSGGCSWNDYDRDGDLDLFTSEWGGSGENSFFKNNGAGANWLSVKLNGVVSNAAAIGAKIRLKASINGSPLWQMREVSGQTGFGAQNGLFAHFGLSDAATIDSLQIEWPSGIVQRYVNIAINEFREITEALPPSPPSNLTAETVSSKEVRLQWTDSTSEDVFVLERSAGDTLNFVKAAEIEMNSVSYVDSALAGNTTYYYRLKARNASGSSDYVSANATTLPEPVVEPKPVTVVLPAMTAEAGETIVVPITVRNFTDILTAQFTLMWDPAALTFLSVSDPALAGTLTNSPSPGALTYTWYDESMAVHSLPEGDTLINVQFTVTGGDSTFTDLDIPADSAGLAKLEFGDADSKAMAAEAVAGRIYIITNLTHSGEIMTVQGIPLNGVNVRITVNDTVAYNVETNAQGGFSFTTIPGAKAVIVPAKDNDSVPNNGVTTLDIALIRRHILGIATINDPFKLIAADVNNSQGVTMTDVAEIRKVILAVETSFSGSLWKFIPEGFPFADPANPFPYDTAVTLVSYVNDDQVNFTAVKLGDINYNWKPVNGRRKALDPVELILPEMSVDNQAYATVPVKVRNFNNISGCQFTLSWDAGSLELTAIAGNPLNFHFGKAALGEGYLTAAWDDPAGGAVTLDDNDAILNLKFRIVNGSSSTISVTSDLTQSVAYDSALSEIEIKAVNGRLSVDAFPVEREFGEVSPNPFDGSGASFHVVVPSAGRATIVIFNAIGRQIDIVSKTLTSGPNTIVWRPASNLPNGLYFYRIKAGGLKRTGKMVLKR